MRFIKLSLVVLSALFTPLGNPALGGTPLPPKPVSVKVEGFCGAWKIHPVAGAPAPKWSNENCSEVDIRGKTFISGNCDVTVGTGKYEFQILADHAPKITFTRANSGQIAVQPPDAGSRATGGKNALTLHSVQLNLKRNGFTGGVAFEYVGYANAQCDLSDPATKLTLPRGGRHLLTAGACAATWISVDRHGSTYSSVQRLAKGKPGRRNGQSYLDLNATKVRVEPLAGYEAVPWAFSNTTGWNQGAGEVYLLPGIAFYFGTNEPDGRPIKPHHPVILEDRCTIDPEIIEMNPVQNFGL